MISFFITGGKKWQEYLEKKFQPKTSPSVKVGIFEGATYPQENIHFPVMDKNGNLKKSKKTYRSKPQKVAEVAFWNEYGTKKSPPRPFFRETIQAKNKEWILSVQKQLKNHTSLVHALENTGNNMKADLIDSIQKGNFRPIARFTRLMRIVNGVSGNKPLSARKIMLQSIAHEVER